PHRICFYLIELAGLFHSLWTAGRENPELRFIVDNDPALTAARLALVSSVAQTLKIGLEILSVTALEEM
ncbi:MAG: DALR anticodon-binding domain-containing protein, partial [Candidatus Puniceispirillaceae bacterium]